MLSNIPGDWVIFPLHGTDGDLCTCGNRRCRSPGKHPSDGIKDFLNTALPRDEAIEKWPDHSGNWGVIPGKSGFVGFDIDVKDGKNGRESFTKLQECYGKSPDTMVIATPSGGFHALFQRPDVSSIPNSNGTIANGIDIRCDNGYLVMPGSVVFGKRYEIFKDDPIAPLPDSWLPLVTPKEPAEIAEQARSIGSYSLPTPDAYQSKSEADFALAGRMKAAGQTFDQFCVEVGNLRGSDRKSKRRKYLEATWNNAIAPAVGDDGEIDLIGFEHVTPGEYFWRCTEWIKITPYGKRAFRFDGAIVSGGFEGVALSLFTAAPDNATGSTKLAQLWRTAGDGTVRFKANYLVDRTYEVLVADIKGGECSKVDHIISPHPSPTLYSTHIRGLDDFDAKEFKHG